MLSDGALPAPKASADGAVPAPKALANGAEVDWLGHCSEPYTEYYDHRESTL